MPGDSPQWKVRLADVSLGDEESKAILETLDSKWLSLGPKVAAFETRWAELHQVPYAIAVSSGTAALHLGLLALGVGPGDEVIHPAINFVAGANMTRAVGATPHFVDIKSVHNPVLDTEAVRRAVNERTRCIMVLHHGGYAADIESLLSIASEHDIAVIEDACHAPLTFVEGRALGGFGDVGCFSFFPNKNMTTAEGGMVVTRRADLAERMRSLRTHGMTALTWERHHGAARGYDVVCAGFNYRLDEIRAAMGLVQLDKLQYMNERRRQLTDAYRQELKSEQDIKVFFADYVGPTAAHLCMVILPAEKRDQVRQACQDAGIQTSMHYPCITSFSAYTDAPSSGTALSEAYARSALTLPLHPNMSTDDVHYVCDVVKRAN